MADLSSKYLGLNLRSPLVVSSSGLTSSVDRIKEMEQSGAGAVVLKSLFEEQIKYEALQHLVLSDYPEALDYMRNYTRHNSVEEYLSLIGEAKKQTTFPVIASINCISLSEWIDFSGEIEEAGADALELNVYFLPGSKDKPGEDYEKIYLELAEKIKETIRIPVVFKLGRQFTNLYYLINQLYFRHVNGVVLFNRFYEPDIDIEEMKLTAAGVFSKPSDIRQTLRWIGLLSGSFDKLDLAASTGVHDTEAVIKLLLAGASVVQVCSVLYKKGISFLETLNKGVLSWMHRHHFETIEDFRGKLSYHNLPDPFTYERYQFMKYFSDYQ